MQATLAPRERRGERPLKKTLGSLESGIVAKTCYGTKRDLPSEGSGEMKIGQRRLAQHSTAQHSTLRQGSQEEEEEGEEIGRCANSSFLSVRKSQPGSHRASACLALEIGKFQGKNNIKPSCRYSACFHARWKTHNRQCRFSGNSALAPLRGAVLCCQLMPIFAFLAIFATRLHTQHATQTRTHARSLIRLAAPRNLADSCANQTIQASNSVSKSDEIKIRSQGLCFKIDVN